MDFAAELRRGINANDLASVRETEAMMDKAADEIDRLRAALRAFTVHATYSVAKEINARGYAWRGEEALDYAKTVAEAALEQSTREAGT
jgi:hypothetical protein